MAEGHAAVRTSTSTSAGASGCGRRCTTAALHRLFQVVAQELDAVVQLAVLLLEACF